MDPWDANAAEWYAEKYGEYATNRLGTDDLELPVNAVVVDVGCGTGCALRHLADRFADATLIGIDPVPRMLEIAGERTRQSPHAGRIEFRPGSATELPFETGAVDLVLAFDTFDYWGDADAAMMEIVRVLRAGGRFVACKDAGDPNAADSGEALLTAVARARMAVLERRELREGDVGCTRWICARE